MPRSAKRPSLDVPRPEVILDFNCSQNLLFVSLKNIGARSAYNVRTTFDHPLRGLAGKKCISDSPLFRCVEFMPPGKEFSRFVDPIGTWFQRDAGNRYSVTIKYDDRDGNNFVERITHNLEIYKDIDTVTSYGGTHG